VEEEPVVVALLVVELEVVVGAEPQPWSPGHRALEQSKVVLDELVGAVELDEDV